MSNAIEAKVLNIHALSSKDLSYIQESCQPELGEDIHSAVAQLLVLDDVIKLTNNPRSIEQRKQPKLIEVTDIQVELLTEVLGWEVVTAALVSLNQDGEDQISDDGPHLEERYPFYEDV